MEIILAKSAGYCFGVSNAVKLTLQTAQQEHQKPIYTYGELIHNKHVVKSLEEKNIWAVDSVGEIPPDSTIIIRSHGVSREVLNDMVENVQNVKIIDATCPYVKSIQNKVEIFHKKGYNIVIVGNAHHPEVIGVNGWCDNAATILYSTQEAEALSVEGKLCVVAQTTIVAELFDSIVEIIKQRYDDVEVFNTICSATKIRQQEAAGIAKTVDAMVIVGDKKSSNTNKLAEVCREFCKSVYHIETALDVDCIKDLHSLKKIGVTAGASTPTKLISEVIEKMEEMNIRENMDAAMDDSYANVKVGDIVEGEVIYVNKAEVAVNIGYKADGIIKKADFLYDLYNDLPDLVAKGDKVKAMIVQMNDGAGNVLLSKIKLDEIEALNEIEAKFENKETVVGKVTKIIKGGAIVDLGALKAFMPASYYDLRFVKDLAPILGSEIEGRIVEFDKAKNKVIFSRRVLLQEARDKRNAEIRQAKEETIAGLSIDQVVEAKVKNVTDFGLFVDLGAMDGFIHVSDLSWKKVSNPKNLYKAGDEIQAKVIDINADEFKVKLSIKDMTKEPWSVFMDQYAVGDTAEVTISSVTKFGAFATIVPEVDGLIHISQISHDSVEKVDDVLKVGDSVKVKIIEIDKDKRKVGLSIKELTKAPKRQIAKNKLAYKEDSTVTLGDLFKDILK